MYKSLFLSCASRNFREMRTTIAEKLRLPFHHVVHQEVFKPGTTNLLGKIDEHIRRTQLVVHLVGRDGGDRPTDIEANGLLEKLNSDYPRTNCLEPQRSSFAFLDQERFSLTYSQWEFWLALTHGIDCMVLRDGSCFPNGLDCVKELDMSQQRHFGRMRAVGHDLTGVFDSESDVCNSIWQYIFGNLAPAQGSCVLASADGHDRGEVIGRADEVEAINDLLELNDLLVIRGTGGAGKTTLASEVRNFYQARGLKVLWINLLRCSDTNSIRGEIVRKVYGDLPSKLHDSMIQASMMEQMAQAVIHYEPSLIVLDNAEHVADSVGEVASELDGIRSNCAHKVLITSQDALTQLIPNGAGFQVDPLSYPEPDDQSQWTLEYTQRCESAILLLRRSRGEIRWIDESNWEAIATICFMLRGIPLTLQLAGGFLASHPERGLSELLERVRTNGAFFDETEENLASGLEAKSKSARASVQWSLSLCSQENLDFLARLALLPDGFTLEMAYCIDLEAVTSGAMNAEDATKEIIRKMCELAIVQPIKSGRYRIVEAVRQHVLETIGISNEKSLEIALLGVLRWIEPYRFAIPCEPDVSILSELTNERGNVLRLVQLGASATSTRAFAKLLFARYIPTLEMMGPAQLVIDRAATFSPKELVELSAADVSRVTRHTASAFWSIGEWKKANAICQAVYRRRFDSARFYFDDISFTNENAAASSGCDIDIILFIADAARMKTLSGYDEDCHKSVDAMLGNAEEMLRKLTISNRCTVKTIAYLHATLTLRRASLLHRRGGYLQAINIANSFLGDDRFVLAPSVVRARIVNAKGLSQWHLGEFQDADESFRDAGKLFQDGGDEFWYAGTLTNRAFLLTDLENFSAAIRLCEQADVLHRKVGNRVWTGTNLGAWGMALIWDHQFDIGVDRLYDGLEIVETNDEETAAQFRGDLGRALLYRNHPSDLQKAIRSLEIAIRMQSDSILPTRRLFGNVVLMADARFRDNAPKATVRSLCQRAREIAKELQLTASSTVLQVNRDYRLLESIEDACQSDL